MKIWNDEKFLGFSDDGKLVFLFLLTHPHMTSIGAMRASPQGLAAELRWTAEKMAQAIKCAVDAQMLFIHPDVACVWIPNFLKYNPPESPSVVLSWKSQLELIPECDMKTSIIRAAYSTCVELGDAWKHAFEKSLIKTCQDNANATEQAVFATIDTTVATQPPQNAKKDDSGPSDAIFMMFPLGVKDKGGSSEWGLTVKKHDEYVDAFPTIDVDVCLRHARQWLRDNPVKRKTSKGMPSFLSRWLSKDVDSGRNRKPTGKESVRPIGSQSHDKYQDSQRHA